MKKRKERRTGKCIVMVCIPVTIVCLIQKKKTISTSHSLSNLFNSHIVLLSHTHTLSHSLSLSLNLSEIFLTLTYSLSPSISNTQLYSLYLFSSPLSLHTQKNAHTHTVFLPLSFFLFASFISQTHTLFLSHTISLSIRFTLGKG
jgi:hypothetical protein